MVHNLFINKTFFPLCYNGNWFYFNLSNIIHIEHTQVTKLLLRMFFTLVFKFSYMMKYVIFHEIKNTILPNFYYIKQYWKWRKGSFSCFVHYTLYVIKYSMEFIIHFLYKINRDQINKTFSYVEFLMAFRKLLNYFNT